MPPQSRGQAPLPGTFSDPELLTPTLRPYLDNLPSPSTIIPDQLTPIAPKPNGSVTRETPTPTGLQRLTDDEENEKVDTEDLKSETNEEEEGEEDDEFESHYSRHSSPASSTADSDEREESANNLIVEDVKSRQENEYNLRDHSLQRINSLPVTNSTGVNGHVPSYSELHTSQSTTSLPPRPPPPPPLYPPFYNRPPTPLPPSPSLTSLLRPPSLLNRSTTSTRPTTPDSSDVETPNDTEAAVAHSARRAHPLPPTAPKVPTYEYYGFVLYLGSSLAFLIYLLWSYLPSPFLHALGITYYPDRWWSLAIPAWIVMALVFIYVALLSYNVEYLTLPLASLECMVDEAGNAAILDDTGRIRKGGSKKFVQEIEIAMKRKERKKKKPDSDPKMEEVGHEEIMEEKERAGRKEIKIDNMMKIFLMKKEMTRNDHYDSYYGIVGLNQHIHHRHMDDVDTAISRGFNWNQVWNEGTDGVMDVPIGGVCQVLYQD